MIYYVILCYFSVVFLFKQKTAYEMRISDWSSDVCSSDRATQHLLELGHEKIAYLGRNRLTSTGRDRFEGFMAAMKKADLKVANDWAIDCPASREDGYRETVKVLSVSRSEEHTSELQSLMRISYAVFCLKKKKHK